MARIYLIMNGVTLNTLDDLKNNFNHQQVIAAYRCKRLQQWLAMRQLDEIVAGIDAIDERLDDDTISTMIMDLLDLDDEQIARCATIAKKDAEKRTGNEHQNELEPGQRSQSGTKTEKPKTSRYQENWSLCSLPPKDKRKADAFCSESKPTNGIPKIKLSEKEDSIENVTLNLAAFLGVSLHKFNPLLIEFDYHIWMWQDDNLYKSADGINWTLISSKCPLSAGNVDSHCYAGAKHLFLYNETNIWAWDDGSWHKWDIRSWDYIKPELEGTDGISDFSINSICEGNEGIFIVVRAQSYTSHLFSSNDEYENYVLFYCEEIGDPVPEMEKVIKGFILTPRPCLGHCGKHYLLRDGSTYYETTNPVKIYHCKIEIPEIQEFHSCQSAVFGTAHDKKDGDRWWFSPDGKNWESCEPNGFNITTYGFHEYNGKFYVIGKNAETPDEMIVARSRDGVTWEKWISLPTKKNAKWHMACTTSTMMFWQYHQDTVDQYLLCESNWN